MKSPASENRSAVRPMVLILIVLAIAAMTFWAMRPGPENSQPAAPSQPVAVAPHPVATNVASASAPASAPATGVLPNYADFKERPFPVSYESSNVQWTLADGKDTNIIRQLAHNPLEYDRMVEENARIFRRQLVYLKQPAAAVFEQAKLTGEAIRQLALPALDGQELWFEIVRGDNQGSSRLGRFSGHLVGNPDSLVTFAFEDGREAFTVLSPKEKIFVVGEPRESGQVIVKAIDPDTYGVGPAEPDEAGKIDSTRK